MGVLDTLFQCDHIGGSPLGTLSSTNAYASITIFIDGGETKVETIIKCSNILILSIAFTDSLGVVFLNMGFLNHFLLCYSISFIEIIAKTFN